MAQFHHHQSQASFRDYLTGQILTILVAGFLGMVGILMYRNDQLGYILALQFHRPVLVGGIAVLVLVMLRAICVWREAGQLLNHVQAGNGVNCCHGLHQRDEMDLESDEHKHGHELSWTFSRLLVLCFPVGLFLIGIPSSGFSQERIKLLLGGEDALTGSLSAVAYRNGTVAGLNDLIEAANDEGKRQSIEGQTAIVEGRIRWIDARQFTLFRMRMTCCAADVVPLKVRIVLMGSGLSNLYDFEWIELKGNIQFVQAPNSDRYIPVIVVQDMNDIRRIESKNKYE